MLTRFSSFFFFFLFVFMEVYSFFCFTRLQRSKTRKKNDSNFKKKTSYEYKKKKRTFFITSLLVALWSFSLIYILTWELILWWSNSIEKKKKDVYDNSPMDDSWIQNKSMCKAHVSSQQCAYFNQRMNVNPSRIY